MKRKKIQWIAAALAVCLSLMPLTACGGAAAEVTLSESNAVLTIGETKQLTATASGGAAVTYTSTDEACASVSEGGLVTAKREGATVVVAEAGGGVAVCEIVVSGEAPVALTSLTITGKPDGGVLENAGSAVLGYQKQPENANDYKALVWASSDDEVAKVDRRGAVTAVSAGACDITLTAVGTSIRDTFRLTVSPRSAAVRLNQSDILGKAGDTFRLSVTVTGDFTAENAEWKSDDETVATVEDGLVSFRGEGSAAVRYTAKFGESTIETSCLVTVGQLSGYTVLRTPEEIQAVQNTSGNYVLGNDVDFAEAVSEGGSLWNGGAGFVPLFSSLSTPFSGVFDGAGYAIRNLMINRPAVAITAFIAFLSGTPGSEGVVRNLAMEGGSITGVNAAPFFGNCSGKGSAASGLFDCCASGVAVNGRLRASGLCLALNGGISNCYSACGLTVESGGARFGVAAMQAAPTAPVFITATFALSGADTAFAALTAEQAVDAVSGLKTIEELKTAETFAGWDSAVWKISDGTLPELCSPYERAEGETV